MSTHPVPPIGTNLAVLVGALSRAPELRSLPSGECVAQLEVTVRPPDAPAESVPVSWLSPPPSVARWDPGEVVVVVGRVRRRFFRAGGATQSRTEVVASRVVPVRRAATVAKAIEAGLAPLEAGL